MKIARLDLALEFQQSSTQVLLRFQVIMGGQIKLNPLRFT